MIQKYLNYFFILILSSFIILKCNPSDPISNSANTNDKNLSSKEKFEKLATEKKNEKTDLEYIKKHGIIKTDVQATNPITQVAVRDFKVSISQIDNSKFPEVTLLVSVTDTDGNPLVVNKDFFNIEENGFKIPKSNIISIVQKKDVDKKSVSRPLNILLAIDKSGSMQGNAKDIGNQPLTFAKDAAIEFIRQAQKNDTVQVIAFDGDIHRLGTNEFAVRRIKSLQPKGSTALYGVLLSSVKELQMGGGIKSVILLTDGRNDTRGTINLELKSVTLEMGLHAADQLAIPVFTIGFGSKADDETLKEIARRTHALYFKTAKKEEILLLYKQIREIINTQYLITYRSESLQEVTDVKVELGRFVDRRTFTTPSFVVNREKKVREDIAIINQEKNRLEQFEKDLNDKAANLKKSQVIFDEEKIALKEQENKLNSEMTKIKLRESELNSFETRVKELESKIKEEKMRLDKVKQSLDSKEASLNEKKIRIEELSEAQAQQSQALDAKSQTLSEKMKRIEKELEEIKSERALLNEKRISLEKKELSLNKEIQTNTELKTLLTAEKESVKNQKERLNKLKTTMDKILLNLQTKYKKALNDVSSHKTELEALNP